jgi:hypothetical protein
MYDLKHGIAGEKYRGTFQDVGIDSEFQNKTPLSQETIASTNKCDCIKLQYFGIVKGIVKRMKKHPKEWEKICKLFCDMLFGISKTVKKLNTGK